VELSPLGIAAHACWTAIPEDFPFVVADTFVAMPDHVHGIIIIDNAGHYRATSNLRYILNNPRMWHKRR
jgi:REP element-mobilizing transposase RayT